MAEERVQRRLAAILAADVVGYSRLMDADEAGTLASLKSIRSEIFDPHIEQFGGRIFKTTGDGALAEFGSSVDAVQCAVKIQYALAARNTETSEDERLVLRIGISQGDVIVDGDDLFGNGVNVAARMEGLAEPGGICISGNVREHIGNSLDIGLEDLGEQRVKNIDRPVPCFRVTMQRNPETKASSTTSLNKPSIAVLPFENMSGDPDQEYFSDGITEDLITALSRIRWFFVTARNSSFAYKGTSPDIREIADKLGVRYVLEGSVRKAGERVRITAQLIDGDSGNHVWAERYDRSLGDIFDLQDEMSEKIVGAIEPAINKAEIHRSEVQRTDKLDAWDLCQQGWWHRYRNRPQDFVNARRLFEQALEIDPNFVFALAGLSEVLSYEVLFSYTDGSSDQIERAIELGNRAVNVDDEDPIAYHSLGRAYYVAEQFENANRALQKALQLNPNSAATYYSISILYISMGRLEEGIAAVEKAMALSPQDIWMSAFHTRLAQAYLSMRNYDKAREHGEEAFRCASPPTWIGKSYLVSALGHLGLKEKAAHELQELLRMRPDITIGWIGTHLRKVSLGMQFREDYFEGLRKAGLPE